MSSTTVLLINAIAYTLILGYFFHKGRVCLGVLIWSVYTISSWSSYFFIQQPMFETSVHASTQTLFPCVYLIIVLFLCVSPLTKIRKIETLYISNSDELRIFLVICIVFQVVFLTTDFQSVINVLTSRSELGDLRETAYGIDSAKTLTEITGNAITNRMALLYSGLNPLLTGLSVLLFYCYKKSRSLVVIFAVTTFMNNLRSIIVSVGRGQLVMMFVIYLFSLILIRDKISKKQKKILLLYITPIFVLGLSVFWAITISRFGDYASFYMYKYMGEPMVDFNGLLFDNIRGNTGGEAYFSYVYRLFGEETFTDAQGKYKLIESVTGLTPFIFYTFVGGLVIEFGKIVPILLAVLFNRICPHLIRENVGLGGAINYIFFVHFFIYGLFTFPIQNFEGLMLVYLFLLNYIFKSSSSNRKRKPQRFLENRNNNI